jgi:hypothetical protein
MKPWSSVLALAAALTGCQHGDEGGGGGGPPVSTAACDQTAPLFCQRFFTCLPDAARFLYGTEQACAIDNATTCRILGTLPGTDKLAIDHLAACNRALSTASCRDLSATPPTACNYLPGTKAVGQGCIDGRQCASKFCKAVPARMESTSPDDRHWCGTCAPTPAAGDPCVLAWGDCGDALLCSHGKCTAPQEEGGACTLSDECDKLLCIEGKCTPPRLAGEPCTHFECASDLRCVAGKCGPGLDNGQPCTDSLECQSFICGDDQLCKEATPMPAVEPGQPCTPGDHPSCRADSRCDESALVCTPSKQLGEPCTRNRECARYLLTCQARKCQPVTDSMCQ